MEKNKRNGQMLPMLIAILFGFLLMTFAIVGYLERESKWTLKEKQTTSAFHLAEAAVDRAEWKLNETTYGWDNCIKGAIPTLYKGTSTFFEPDQGYYKVLVSTERVGEDDYVIIKAVALDIQKKETRALMAKFSRSAAVSGASIRSVTGVTISGNMTVHWGPILNSKGNIDYSAHFPRKLCGTGFYVIGRDGNGIAEPNIGDTNGADSRNQPLDDEYKDWSSNNKRDVPEIEVNITSYAARAKAYTPPAGRFNGTADPAGSGYFTGNVSIDNNFNNLVIDNQPDFCIYSVGNMDLTKMKFIGPGPITNADSGKVTSNNVAVICRGTLSFPTGSGTADPYNVYIPSAAWKEYQAIDTGGTGDYNGDDGFRANKPYVDVNTFSGGVCVYHGFMYCGGTFDINSGNKKIVGVCIVGGSVTGSGTCDVYYSKVVDESVIYNSQKFSRKYWAEFMPYSFDTPRW